MRIRQRISACQQKRHAAVDDLRGRQEFLYGLYCYSIRWEVLIRERSGEAGPSDLLPGTSGPPGWRKTRTQLRVAVTFSNPPHGGSQLSSEILLQLRQASEIIPQRSEWLNPFLRHPAIPQVHQFDLFYYIEVFADAPVDCVEDCDVEISLCIRLHRMWRRALISSRAHTRQKASLCFEWA